MVEMIELTSILKRNNKNTLVLADEIARGSESKSANIIVTYMLKTLSESNSSFITATHLHELINISTIKKLNNVKIKHIKVTLDDENNKLIYDRELSEGSGSSFYGLQVAKYLMNDSNFRQMLFSNGARLLEYRLRKKNSMEFNNIVKGQLFEKKQEIEKMINKQEREISIAEFIEEDKTHSNVDAKIRDTFVADAFLANRDALASGNMIVKNDIPYRVDNGGALRNRSSGGMKGVEGDAWDKDLIPELETLPKYRWLYQNISINLYITSQSSQFTHTELPEDAGD
jgi:hypothetical protein